MHVAALLEFLIMFHNKQQSLSLNKCNFPGSSAGKEPTCSAGDPCSILGSGRSPGEGLGYSLQYSSLLNPHGQRSLVGYSPWGHKELNVTEWPCTHKRKYTNCILI